MPWGIVKNIIDECAEIGVYSILFSWRGESTLYKSGGYDFADVLMYARQKGILERTCLTNGRAFNNDLIERTIDAQPSWLSFSVDGLGEIYNKIRKPLKREMKDKWGSPFVTIMRNISKIIWEREEKGYILPQIRCNTIFPPIFEDPDEYRELMEFYGIGLVTVNKMLR